MRDRLTKSYRELFLYLRSHPGVRHGIRELAEILDQSANTVRKGLRVLKDLGWLITKILGGPWHAAAYECTEEGQKVVAEFEASFGSNLRRQVPASVQDGSKSDTTICPTCGGRGTSLGEGSRVSAIDAETRARLTTDRLSDTEQETRQESQSVVGWLRKRFGGVGEDLQRRVSAAVRRTGDPEEWVLRFFEQKWVEVQMRLRSGALSYASAGLFQKALDEGEMRAWKNLHAEELAREMRFNARVEEDARKGMGVEETASGHADPVAEVERLKAMGAFA